MNLIIALLLSSQANAYTIGSAPFCIEDNLGNQECFYYTRQACKDAKDIKPNPDNLECVKKDKQ